MTANWRLYHARALLKDARRKLERFLATADLAHLEPKDRGRLQRAVWNTEKALEEIQQVLPPDEEESDA